MPRVKRIAQNVLSNWLALGITTIVGFFLSPFVVHHLGNAAYGVWVIVASLVSYMGLLDLGMRNAVVRYVSKGATQINHDEASQAVSGALWIRLWISLAIAFVGLLLAAGFRHIFVVPIELQQPARVAVLITAIAVGLNLWCGVFGGVLAAFHRYDLTSVITILQAVGRACGFVLLLWHGYGIVALALWDLVTSVAANAAYIILAFRVYPQLKISFGRPDTATLKKLWNYSLFVFLINLAVQVTYYSDNLVVGAFLSPTAVTLYAVGGILIAYSRQVVSSMTTTFAPLASTFEALGGHGDLQRLLIHGTRAALIVSLPIEVALFVRGHTFIHLWMGAQYAQPSGTVMQILLLSLAVSSANTTSGGIVYGMEKHRRIAIWAIVEAVANLALSLVLVRRMGIIGVAWGTAIPSVVVELLLWPSYVCKLLNVRTTTYIWQVWIRTTLGVVPFGLGCLLVERFWPVHNLAAFFAQIALLLPLFPLTLALIFRREIMAQAPGWIQRWRVSRRVRNEYQPSTSALS